MLSARNTSITSNLPNNNETKKMPSKTILLCALVQTNRWTIESCVRNRNWFLLDISPEIRCVLPLESFLTTICSIEQFGAYASTKSIWCKKSNSNGEHVRFYIQRPKFAKHFTKYFMTLEKWDVQQCLRGNCCNCWQRKICFCTENGKSIVLILILSEMFAFQCRASLLSKLLVLILRNIFGGFFCGLVCCSFFLSFKGKIISGGELAIEIWGK